MVVRKRVLVAGSDEEETRRLSSELVELGWEVLRARDAVAATSAALRIRPDAVILDGPLHGGGGVLTLRRIRASVHTAMTPVIAISDADTKDADALRAGGVDALLPHDAGAISTWFHKRLSEPLEVLEAPPPVLRDADRLAALDATGLLDSPPTESFDALTRLASHVLGVPVALVSLVDRDRQFFVSQIGLPDPWATDRETPLTHSFCQWVVSGHEDLVIADARDHPVLSVNRALRDLGVVAYAGLPLTATGGQPLGSLCAIDTRPHGWSADDLAVLRELSHVAEAHIALAEARTATAGGASDTVDPDVRRRSLVTQALGRAVVASTNLLRRADPRIHTAERDTLLQMVGWFGERIAHLT